MHDRGGFFSGGAVRAVGVLQLRMVGPGEAEEGDAGTRAKTSPMPPPPTDWLDVTVTLAGGKALQTLQRAEAALAHDLMPRLEGAVGDVEAPAAAAEAGVSGAAAAARAASGADRRRQPVGTLLLRLSYRVLPRGAPPPAPCLASSRALLPARGAGAPAPAEAAGRGDGGVGHEPQAQALPLRALPELPVARMPRRLHSYMHGACMGAALSMLSDPRWCRILQREDDEAHAAAQGWVWHSAARPDARLRAAGLHPPF